MKNLIISNVIKCFFTKTTLARIKKEKGKTQNKMCAYPFLLTLEFIFFFYFFYIKTK